MKRITGFLREAIREIERQPGQSAAEIVDQLLRDGRARTAAQNPQASLGGTLHKHYKEHGLDRRKEGGVYRYYPRNGRGSSQPASPAAAPADDNIVVTVRLPRGLADVIDVLIATGSARDREGAVRWLVERGISSLRR